MSQIWIKFQGISGQFFGELMALLPGTDLLKLVACSAFMGILMVWLYSLVSFQKKLGSLKKRISTVIFEPYLFHDSARISLLTPLRLFGLALKYMALSIPPLMVLAVPTIWILGLWNQVVGYEPLALNQPVVVSVVADTSKKIRQLQLSSQGEDLIITPLVRSFHDSRAWAGLQGRVSNASGALLLKVGDESISIPLDTNITIPVLTDSIWSRVLFPGADIKLPAGIKEVSIGFLPRYFEVLGTRISWVVLFLIVSMLSGLIFAKKFKIQI